jgi:nicotinate phosphoribosyltransferase
MTEVRQTVMTNGRPTREDEPLSAMAGRCRDQLARLPEGCLRLVNPHRYKVSISSALHELRGGMVGALTARRVPE